MICATGPGQQRLDVGRGRELRVGHDRRRVGVHEHDLVALLGEHLARLRARVVELGRLADHDRPRAEDHDPLEVVAAGHQPRHLREEAVEEVQRVVRPGPRLGVVLDRAGARFAQPQPLDGAVVEVDVGQLGRAEVRAPADRLVGVERVLSARPDHGEAMILGGDLDAPGAQVLDRVVGAAVPEAQLVGVEARRAAQQLVPEADAEDRHAADHLAQLGDDVVERGGVARAVAEHHRVGAGGEDLLRRRCSPGGSAARAPRARRLATIESLTPVSMSAIVGARAGGRREHDRAAAG